MLIGSGCPHTDLAMVVVPRTQHPLVGTVDGRKFASKTQINISFLCSKSCRLGDPRPPEFNVDVENATSTTEESLQVEHSPKKESTLRSGARGVHRRASSSVESQVFLFSRAILLADFLPSTVVLVLVLVLVLQY